MVLIAGCPAQVLYVGDDVHNDIDGAVAAGMSAVLFDPKGTGPKFESPTARPFATVGCYYNKHSQFVTSLPEMAGGSMRRPRACVPPFVHGSPFQLPTTNTAPRQLPSWRNPPATSPGPATVPGHLGVQVLADANGQAVIVDVEADSPADKVGLMSDDILVQVGREGRDQRRGLSGDFAQRPRAIRCVSACPVRTSPLNCRPSHTRHRPMCRPTGPAPLGVAANAIPAMG